MAVSVTNVGTRATVVNNISIRVGRWKRQRRFAVINMVRDAYSAGIPLPLADGQQAFWGIPIGKDDAWFHDLCDKFVLTEEDVRTFRFFVHTNHGESLELVPEPDMLSKLRDALAKKAKNAADRPAA